MQVIAINWIRMRMAYEMISLMMFICVKAWANSGAVVCFDDI
jgi:hypothetical protein